MANSGMMPRGARARRRAVVMMTFLGSIAGVSLLLMLLAPAPLAPDASRTLFATGVAESIEQALEPGAPPGVGRWRRVFVHHSRTDYGSAATLGRGPHGLGDHFLIGNGRGCADGEIQVSRRWDMQLAAAPPGATLGDDCISICLVGDFDRAAPTTAQLRRLEQLIVAIRERYGVAPENVVAFDVAGSPAGIGRNFPPSRHVRTIRP